MVIIFCCSLYPSFLLFSHSNSIDDCSNFSLIKVSPLLVSHIFFRNSPASMCVFGLFFGLLLFVYYIMRLYVQLVIVAPIRFESSRVSVLFLLFDDLLVIILFHSMELYNINPSPLIKITSTKIVFFTLIQKNGFCARLCGFLITYYTQP